MLQVEVKWDLGGGGDWGKSCGGHEMRVGDRNGGGGGGVGRGK